VSSHFEDPWVDTLKGPWRESMLKAARPCHYGCGHLAPMTEPGRTWKAHKVCAQIAAGIEQAVIVPLSEDPEGDRKPLPADGVMGCGTPAPGQTDGMACGGIGGKPSCQLCPSSPTFWRGGESEVRRMAHPNEWTAVTDIRDGATG
jgi:hypothetical protein